MAPLTVAGRTAIGRVQLVTVRAQLLQQPEDARLPPPALVIRVRVDDVVEGGGGACPRAPTATGPATQQARVRVAAMQQLDEERQAACGSRGKETLRHGL